MTSPACCKLAETLGPQKLQKLNAELRDPEHRSFRKLADALGVPGQKSAVERHKKQCLGIGQGFDAPPKVEGPKDLPPVKLRGRGTVSLGQAGTGGGVPEVSQATPARARAPEAAIPATPREERVLAIVSQMAAGTWEGPRDISVRAGEWGLDRDTVRLMATEAALVCRIDRGSVEDRRQASMGHWRRVYEEAMLQAAAPGEFDAASKLLAVAAQAQTGWDKAAGLADDKVVVNIGTDPGFRQAAERYVATVQGVLADAGALAARVAARLGLPSVPLDVVAAVLAEADAAIVEQVQPDKPALLTTGESV